jgi:alpha-tubulin suppressor-like RCC1 family protein
VRARMRIAAVLAGGVSGALACNAIVGVEDVRLANRLDGGPEEDTGSPEDDAGGPADATTTPEASVELALGFLHTCARKTDGLVRCWGDDGAGQLGGGIPFDGGTRSPVLTPKAVVGLTDAVAVASGVAHSCAVKRGGSVVCWGINTFGSLGDGTLARSSSPVAVKDVANAVAVAAGTSFSCALLSGGTVSCWGANYSGQLGDGTKVDRPTAVTVQQLTGAVGLATAEHHACAVLSDGTVKCWGKNDDGQLGNGTLDESLAPATISSLSDIVEVAAAARFSCARQRGGQVYCWGANVLGQLGTGSANAAPNPSPALTRVSDAVALWVGYEHGCAARRTGQIVCWGASDNGQVGSGSDAAVLPDPQVTLGVSGALGVGTGGNHSCATTRTGAVFCWGNNTFGQLGDGSKNRAYTAVPVVSFP